MSPARGPGWRLHRSAAGFGAMLLDGQPAAAAARATSFALSGVDRGSHRLQALIVDARGRVPARSAPVTFYMRQASRLFSSWSR